LPPWHTHYSPGGAFAKPLTASEVLCLLGRAAVATGQEHAPLRMRPKAVALLARLALAERPLVAQGAAAWIGDEPYISDAVADAQVRAAPNAKRFVAGHSSHPMLVRDPEPEMVERIKEFGRALV